MQLIHEFFVISNDHVVFNAGGFFMVDLTSGDLTRMADGAWSVNGNRGLYSDPRLSSAGNGIPITNAIDGLGAARSPSYPDVGPCIPHP